MIVLEKVFSYLQQRLNCSILFRFQCHTVIPDSLKKKLYIKETINLMTDCSISQFLAITYQI